MQELPISRVAEIQQQGSGGSLNHRGYQSTAKTLGEREASCWLTLPLCWIELAPRVSLWPNPVTASDWVCWIGPRASRVLDWAPRLTSFSTQGSIPGTIEHAGLAAGWGVGSASQLLLLSYLPSIQSENVFPLWCLSKRGCVLYSG